jgi:4-diphosphocytidyl-2-C-methyl-D-erythritol kinase
LILFPNCKINLGLQVTGKRPDGYHNIETIFYPLPLRDVLEIITGPSVKEEFELMITGITIPGDNNLCKKAWELIKKDFPEIPPVKILLHKAIPIGAGLGGGSSDGAFTLMLLNKKLELGLSEEQLRNYALQLGSDCPFFILNKPCIATGRGELMQEINMDLKDYYFVLVNPEIHISTAWAFSEIPRFASRNFPLLQRGRRIPDDVTEGSLASWKESLINDFEAPVFEAHPELRTIKEELYNAGAIYASLTGTGSCVYGIFNKTISDVKLRTNFKVYQLNIS